MKNNKGFSLVELIIVIALLSILTGVSVVGFGYLYSTDVKNSIKKIDSSLQKVQSYTVSKSIGGKDIGMKLKQGSDGCYYVEYIGIPNLSDEEFGKKNLKVAYQDSSMVGSTTWKQVNATAPLEIYFDRATGGLQPLNNSNYISKIRITIGSDFNSVSDCCTIELSKITGKTTIKVYQ